MTKPRPPAAERARRGWVPSAPGGVRVAGGFDKSKTMRGAPVGNRFVIVRWDDMAAYEKGQSMGIKAWVDKHAPDAREIITESVEGK